MVQVFFRFSVPIVLFFGYDSLAVWLFCCLVDCFPNKKSRLAFANLPIHKYYICSVGVNFKFFACCLV